MLRTGAGLDEHVDDRRIDHGAAAGDGDDRIEQLLLAANPLLQEVGTTPGAVLQQIEGIFGLCVLTEYDHADIGSGLPQARGDADALVGL